ncbi:hypothetical protein L873DRAFT_728435 [Choiromyces venosus 120613-1]|uniref:Uncharacterized protein n=1 Tax=Choiromyces venosus 120613-1 TaxID=1336337 RepID=A0A3N4JVG9_9PEZI|nr:hypothetical protein L873DRAFT_728435 [Choiromyces venosus 120613-1]
MSPASPPRNPSSSPISSKSLILLGETPRLGGDEKEGGETCESLDVTIDGVLEGEAARGGVGADGWAEPGGELWGFEVRDVAEDINDA